MPLAGWFIPATGSDKLVIANHPMGLTRSGLPTHSEPWRSVWAATGDGFEVGLVPDYRILHDAGYNVLAYDLRNHGLGSAVDGGLTSSGIFEARDVVGPLTTPAAGRTRSVGPRNAAALLVEHGVTSGDRVHVMATNRPEFLDVLCGGRVSERWWCR